MSVSAHEAAVQVVIYTFRDKANMINLSCSIVPDHDLLAAQNEDLVARNRAEPMAAAKKWELHDCPGASSVNKIRDIGKFNATDIVESSTYVEVVAKGTT